jgi:hypothetical protein
MKKWWENEPLCIVELHSQQDMDKRDPSWEAKKVKELGGNAQHHIGIIEGRLDTSRFYFRTEVATKRNRDYLAEYLPEAHKRGIKVVLYFNVHAVNINFAKKYPDWQQIKEDGKPKEDVYNTESTFCVNSPWRDWVFQVLKDLAKYKIDGIFYDGPIFFAETCYCSSCRKLFRETYREGIPSKSKFSNKRDEPAWSKLLEFQSDSIARFLADSQKVIKEINPHILLYMNGNTVGPFWPTGRDNRKIIKESDILGAEGGFLHGDLRVTPIFKPGSTAKLLENQAQGKPRVIFDCAGHKPWTFSSLPSEEIGLLYAQTIAHGANVWLAICGEPEEYPEQVKTIKRYNNFIHKNKQVYTNTHSLARIALVCPQHTANFYAGSSVPLTDFTKEERAEKSGDVRTEFYGFYDGLLRGHFPFDVIDEKILEEKIDRKCDLLIFPNAACLSKKAVENIKDFVRQGGNLLSTFETSLYDEKGKQLRNFQLAEVMGIKETKDVFGPRGWDYLLPQQKEHFALEGINSKYVASPAFGIKTITGNKANQIISFYQPLPGRYVGLPEISDIPFLIHNKYGKGNSIYIAGDFGSSLWEFRLPEHYHILGNLVNKLHQPIIKTGNLPASVDISIRQNRSNIFIHLINFSSEMKRPIEKIIPIPDVEISLPFLKRAEEVKALYLKRKLKIEKENPVSFKLPLLEKYEVISIKPKRIRSRNKKDGGENG